MRFYQSFQTNCYHVVTPEKEDTVFNSLNYSLLFDVFLYFEKKGEKRPLFVLHVIMLSQSNIPLLNLLD